MTLFVQDFEDRVKEIENFFDFLTQLELRNGSLYVINITGNPWVAPFIVNSDLFKTLKSTCFLLLYNLVESTMTSAIQAIYDELKSAQVPFSNLHDDLKLIILSGFKRKKVDGDLLSLINDISMDIVSLSFDAEELFSGNVDSRKIKDMAAKYGFSVQTDDSKTRGGSDLVIVKNKRNTLAHGVESFSNIGKLHSTNELTEIKERVIFYLKDIINNIEKYINHKNYLKSTSSNDVSSMP